MALTERAQFTDALNRSRDVLIAVRKEWNVDGIASALALSRILEKRGKRPHVVCDGFAPTKALGFLPNMDAVQPEVRNAQKFIVSLDVSKAALGELSYEMADGKLHIYLTPKSGRYLHEDVSTSSSKFRYDLVITVDTPDYASLAKPFQDHAQFFYDTPVVNIDHDAANEQFGNVNLVDVTAASTSEIIYRAFTDEKTPFLDEDVATFLLAGLVAKTKSFKTPNVTPATLAIASELMSAGARQEDVMRNLYRTRSLATLKLWGRALARLKYDPVTKMTWTLLVRQDFIHAGANENDLPDVIDELIVNSPEADVIGLIYEQESETGMNACAIVSTEKHGNAMSLVSPLKPEGHRKLARVCFPKTNLVDAEKRTLQAVRKSLGKPGEPLIPDALTGDPVVTRPFEG